MERIIQYLDELDDLISTLALLGERIRNLALSLVFMGVALLVPIAGVVLALSHPPLALGTALLLFVSLLYRSVTVGLKVIEHPL